MGAKYKIVFVRALSCRFHHGSIQFNDRVRDGAINRTGRANMARFSKGLKAAVLSVVAAGTLTAGGCTTQEM